MIDRFYGAAKPLIFRTDAERAHERVMAGLARASASPRALRYLGREAAPNPRLAVSTMGLRFDSPVLVAAGLDKNGVAFPALHALGFGGVEVGTVTPRPQAGNERPRVFRLVEDRALVNRMGFPGEGMHAVAANLERLGARDLPIGINLGPNRESVQAGASAEDCVAVLRFLAPWASYLVINISSPNTAQLRDLHGREALEALLGQVLAARPTDRPVPILVKISPDLDDRELDDVLQVVIDTGIDGIVATNTTVSRPETLRSPNRDEKGGLSGAPLRERSLQVVRRVAEQTGGRLPLMAVGGISYGADLFDAIAAGATVAQVYTGLVYRGPAIAADIQHELLAMMDRFGIRTLDELRGSGLRA